MKLKMGTVSEAVIRKLQNNSDTLVSTEDNKLLMEAFATINKMKTPWGIIHEPWFEKVNNVSALLGFVAGAAMVGAVVGVRKIITCKRAEEWVEAITDDEELDDSAK